MDDKPGGDRHAGGDPSGAHPGRAPMFSDSGNATRRQFSDALVVAAGLHERRAPVSCLGPPLPSPLP